MASRSGENAWRRLYDTPQWKGLREAQLSASPLCGRCLSQGIVEAATVVHHSIPHRGNLELFWSGPFESICASHHNSQGQLEDHGKKTVQFDEKGWPI